ncbi:ABC transporter permease [Streptomyces marispadix]|uniref:ABC transporter permease n=1 Tax=Streptomyces marispadix TaxID=2922868 RepID=A0ABS9SZE6_9ACTN|nr:ABC transporter permease [Streptomyces marispadix]MCH6161666.1 ABC transporter permease [Streptomyces marispadix]
MRSVTGGRAPLVLAVPALLAVAFLLIPLLGILARTEWRRLGAHLTSPGVTDALSLSLLVSLWALALSLVLGVPLAWLLARVDFPGKAVVRSLVLLPMVLPPTVAGVALLLGLGRRGLAGPWLESTFGVTLPFHTSGAVLAATFVAMPFLVISLEGALAGIRPGYEETAASLGASPTRVFFTVTLPMAGPGLAAGAALTWARALGEFGATITFAGNLAGVTQTLPLQVYLLLQNSPEAATSVSLLLLAVAMAVLVALRGRWTGGGAGSRAGSRTGGHGRDQGREHVQGRDRDHDRDGDHERDGDHDQDGDRDPDASALDADAAPHADPAAPDSPFSGRSCSLHADVTGFDQLTLDAEPGTTIAVVGPNGAGKTTLLRALLGLDGRARARALRLGDMDATHLPPHRRGVAWVPQDGALFPHLSALANTAYGLRAQGVPRREARRTAQLWLDRLGAGRLAHRRPAQLSGGQAQRVALARALAVRPGLLLLDEPLAALDRTAGTRVRRTLRTHLAGFGGVCLVVTHSPVEAVSLADRILVLDDGRTVQDASPAEVTRRPRSPWVARMLGHNAWPGGFGPDGTLTLDAGGGTLVVAEPLGPGTPALAVIAPGAVSVHRRRPYGSPRNVWAGTVRELTAVGGRLRVAIEPEGAPELVAEITPQAASELRLAEGSSVWASVKATEITVVGV